MHMHSNRSLLSYLLSLSVLLVCCGEETSARRGKADILSWNSPRVFSYSSFLSSEECDELIKVARNSSQYDLNKQVI